MLSLPHRAVWPTVSLACGAHVPGGRCGQLRRPQPVQLAAVVGTPRMLSGGTVMASAYGQTAMGFRKTGCREGHDGLGWEGSSSVPGQVTMEAQPVVLANDASGNQMWAPYVNPMASGHCGGAAGPSHAALEREKPQPVGQLSRGETSTSGSGVTRRPPLPCASSCSRSRADARGSRCPLCGEPGAEVPEPPLEGCSTASAHDCPLPHPPSFPTAARQS